MTAIQAAAAGEAAAKAVMRGRSTIDFPYFDQDEAVAAATAVHAVGGTSCTVDQLAAQMRQAPGGGGFRVRLMAARTFGILTYERGSVTLTDLGGRIIDPKFQRSARVESFLAVPLFKTAYEKLKGSILPPNTAIERTFETLGVAPKQKDKARQVFIRSAKQAGFFEIDPERLTYPPNVNSFSAPREDLNAAADRSGQTAGSRTSDLPDVHVAIQGLLRELPVPGTPWGAQKKERFLQAFKSTIDFIYPEEDKP
jgi:hypothetical protein